MTKKELRRYRKLESEINTLDAYIKKLEREAEKVPTITDKVQTSMKEWPYLPAHESVQAPEPHRYTKIQRLIVKNERLKADAVAELTRLDNSIHAVEDARARTILIQVYILGRKQSDVAIEMDLSYQRVSNIISETLSKRNKR